MKVQELLVSMKRKDFDLEKWLQVKKYLPIEVKKTIAKGIIYDCTEEVNGVIKIDTVAQYMSYVKYMIKYHTNLEYDEVTDYDVLCSTDYVDAEGNTSALLNAILECFASDAKECSKIMGMMTDDCLQENNITFVVAKFLNGIGGTLGDLAGVLKNKVDSFNLESLGFGESEIAQFKELANKYVK